MIIRNHTRALALCIVALGLPCCGTGGPTLSYSDLQIACNSASDCLAVTVDVCAPCACPDSAINRAYQGKYQADYAQARQSCGSMPACSALCAQPQVACQTGRCVLVK